MAQLDPSIPLNAMGANPQQPQQQMSNALQVFQMKDAMQQRNQAQQQQQNEKRTAKKLDVLTNRGVGLFLKYRSLIDDGKLSHTAAQAAMQEDFKREVGGIASERDENGLPLFTQEELQGLGQEFNAGELGMILPKLMGAKQSMDMYFKQQELKAQGVKTEMDERRVSATERNADIASRRLDETERHNREMEATKTKASSPFEKEADKLGARKYQQMQDAAMGADQRKAEIALVREDLTKAFKGTGAGAKMAGAKIANFLSGGSAFSGDLVATERLQRFLGRTALELRNPAGGAGMPGAMSDKDREFLRDMAGKIENQDASIEDVLFIVEQVEDRKAAVASLADDYVEANGKLDQGFYRQLKQWSAENPMNLSASSAAPKAAGAKQYVRTGIDKKTGKRVGQLADGTVEVIE